MSSKDRGRKRNRSCLSHRSCKRHHHHSRHRGDFKTSRRISCSKNEDLKRSKGHSSSRRERYERVSPGKRDKFDDRSR